MRSFDFCRTPQIRDVAFEPVHCKWTRADHARTAACGYRVAKTSWDTRRYLLQTTRAA